MRGCVGHAEPVLSVKVELGYSGFGRDLWRRVLYGEPEELGAHMLASNEQIRPAELTLVVPARMDREFRHQRVRRSLRRSESVDIDRRVENGFRGGSQYHCGVQ